MTADIEISGLGPARTQSGPVASVLESHQLPTDTTHVTVIATDGYRASIPLEVLREGGVLSVEENAWRLEVVDGNTLCWNVKDVIRLEPTHGKAEDDIPENPSH